MRPYGFSKGSLAHSDFDTALEMMRGIELDALELSALREDELVPLLEALPRLELATYSHVSIHAPSKLDTLSEADLVKQLQSLKGKFPIIVHPDVIADCDLWSELGGSLLVENMDKRKPVGRTAAELELIFERLPDARLCLDVGHSKQIDPSLLETRRILLEHGTRLAEIHLSEVNSASGHEALNAPAISAFEQIAHLIPEHVPIILETPVTRDAMALELEKARSVFGAEEPARACS